MACATTAGLSDREYLEDFHQRAVRLRTPLSGSIDLTHRCNLKCIHCYLGPEAVSSEAESRELPTRDLLSLIDQITEAGCLFVVITGGEPLVRADFADIYRRCKANGLLVTVFTNGTLVTDRILDLFGDLPPQAVEITLYGVSAATFEAITGVVGSFERCTEGIRRLLERKIEVRLKTILMTENQHELSAIEAMARHYGVRFRFDPAIFPRFDGDRRPLKLRVSAGEAVEREMSDRERLRQWIEYCDRMQSTPIPETLYKCGAGLTSFHIDPYGDLMPCLMTASHRFGLSGASFLSVWNGGIARVRDMKAAADLICNTCSDQLVCGYCPAFFGLENGSEDIRSEYLCAMGKERSRRIAEGARKG
jgi:radical SAM protein with 4Fe4S-binding SPASM domain